MCIALPHRVLALQGQSALVEVGAGTQEVSLLLLTEEVAAGDYLLVQAGGFAFARLDAEDALRNLREAHALLEAGGEPAFRDLGAA